MPDENSEGDAPARRGRPRKWASEAERKSAYRARKATELAEPARLRVELRDTRREIRRLEKEGGRLHRTVQLAGREAREQAQEMEALRAEIELKASRIAYWQGRTARSEEKLRQHRDGN